MKKKTLQLFPLASEPNLWKAMDLEFEGVEGELYGLVMTYVDDIFVNGSNRVVQAILKGIQDTWVTSSPEHISAKAVSSWGWRLASAAEAELTEVIEGMIAGESIGVIVDELFGP